MYSRSNVENHSHSPSRHDMHGDMSTRAVRLASAEWLDESTWNIAFKQGRWLSAPTVVRDAASFEQ